MLLAVGQTPGVGGIVGSGADEMRVVDVGGVVWECALRHVRTDLSD